MVTALGFQLIATTTYWSIWADPAFYTTNRAWFTSAAIAHPDDVIKQLKLDFGYDIFPIPSGQSYDGIHLDLVLDPASAGGAHTGSVFGNSGISVSPDSIYTSYNGIAQFWWFILTTHETVNVYTGALASGWPWADGSPIWLGGSQFPNFCDIVVTKELGLSQVSEQQALRELPQPGVKFLYDVQTTLSWVPYQVMFQWVHFLRISWLAIEEPVRSGLLALILAVSGVGISILTGLQRNGIIIPLAAVLDAQTRFPLIPALFVSVSRSKYLLPLGIGSAAAIAVALAALASSRSRRKGKT